MSRISSFVLSSALVFSAAAWGPAGPVFAEVEAESATDTTEAAAEPTPLESKRAELRQLGVKGEALEKSLAFTQGIDAKILNQELDRVRMDYAAAMHDLARMAFNEDVDPQVRDEALSDVVGPMQEWVDPLIAYATGLEKKISSAAQQRDEADPASVVSAEQDFGDLVAKQNSVLELLADHAALMKELDLDAAKLDAAISNGLEYRAQITAGRISRALEQSKRFEKRLKLQPDNADAKLQLVAESERIKASVASLQSTVKLMGQYGLDAAQYKQLLVTTTGQFSPDIFDKGVAVGLLARWWQQVRGWFSANGLNLVVKILVFFAIMTVFRVLAGLATRLVSKALSTSKVRVSALLRSMLERTAGTLVLLAGLLVALAQLGISVGPLVAGLGIAGFIVGFALQDTLSNFAAGMMILFYRPFDVGDIIESAGVTGKVSNMNLVSTTILTFDNQTLILPNSKIWGDVIRNITAQNQRRVDLAFGIGYGDDIDHAQKVLNEIVSGHELVLKDPEPVVELSTLGESSVDFIVRPWAKTVDYWRVYWDITKQVKQRFDAEGISIPFPQRDVHMFTADAIAISQKGTEAVAGAPVASEKSGNGKSAGTTEVEPEGDPAS
jgi:small conductance mechanosensitive channel